MATQTSTHRILSLLTVTVPLALLLAWVVA